MTHKNKVRLARRLREQEANAMVNFYKKKDFPADALRAIHRQYMRTSIFLTQLWNERRENRAAYVHNREVLAQQRKTI